MLHGTSKIDDNGHLNIGGIDTTTLAKKYGTPLFVYDVAHIRHVARTFLQAFSEHQLKGKVAYASKAFSSMAMIQLIQEEGLHLDVVSGGELYTALQSGYPASHIHLHGNNKSREEMNMALDADIGCIVIDNFDELNMLEDLLADREQTVNVLLRITPGIEAHTHEYITTGQEDSKFGFDLGSGQVKEALSRVLAHDQLCCLGLHCHIGSQIFETKAFELTIETIFRQFQSFDGFIPEVLNLGGGFGIAHTSGDSPESIDHFIGSIARTVKDQADKLQVTVPEIWIEPGRSIVGNAGTTLYTAGSIKEVPGIRQYLAVDGGMTDNIRPALYDAKYEGFLANRANEEHNEYFSIAGKCCESGDMLIWDLPLPSRGHHDILAVTSTGGYGYAMANNYNRLPRPAVVFVENGISQEVIRRETYEDIIRYDRPLKEWADKS